MNLLIILFTQFYIMSKQKHVCFSFQYKNVFFKAMPGHFRGAMMDCCGSKTLLATSYGDGWELCSRQIWLNRMFNSCASEYIFDLMNLQEIILFCIRNKRVSYNLRALNFDIRLILHGTVRNNVGADWGWWVLPGVHGHPAGHRIPDAGAGAGISGLHDDERPLLQSDHAEVLRVIQRLQKRSVTRPGMVAQTQVSIFPPANLEKEANKLEFTTFFFCQIASIRPKS